jgi:hypothetical protein
MWMYGMLFVALAIPYHLSISKVPLNSFTWLFYQKNWEFPPQVIQLMIIFIHILRHDENSVPGDRNHQIAGQSASHAAEAAHPVFEKNTGAFLCRTSQQNHYLLLSPFRGRRRRRW